MSPLLWSIGISALLAPHTVDADPITLASGVTVTFADVIFEEEPSIARFRFLAPDIGPDGYSYEEVAEDLVFLCQQVALPALANAGRDANEIVISLMDRMVPFGADAPEAIQFFEPFSVSEGLCIWEQF